MRKGNMESGSFFSANGVGLTFRKSDDLFF